MPAKDASPPTGPAPTTSPTDIDRLTRCNIYSEGTTPSSAQMMHRLELLKEWGIRPGQTVLEIGCGQGDTASVLAAAVGEEGHVTGMDPAPFDYGAPWNIETAQKFLSDGPLGSRLTWVQANPVEWLDTHQKARFDVAVLAHCIWYFANPTLLKQTLKSLSKHVDQIILAEYALLASQPSAQPHVLAVLAEAALECHKLESEANVRNVVSPASLKKWTEEVGLILLRETVVSPGPGLQDGRWELSTVTSDGFLKEIQSTIKDERELGSVIALRDACLAAVELVGGVIKCTTMDVWTGVFKS